MPYDIIGADEAEFVGADDEGDEVDQILSGMEIVGAHRYASRGGSRRGGGLAARGQRAPGGYASRGGRGGGSAHSGQAMAYALQNKRAAAGLIVDQQRPGAARRLVLGMASTGAVAAGAIAQIVARPQNLAFKPQRIVIPSTIAPDFLITDIKVGNVSQMVQSGTLPAEAFTQQLFDGMMEMDTVQTSQDFVLQVQNIAGAPRNFNAAVYGLALLAR